MHLSISPAARALATLLVPLAVASLGGGCKGEDIGQDAAPLTAACVDAADPPPAGGWMCGQNETVECDSHAGAHVDFIYATLAPTKACSSVTLTVNEPGPFLPGAYGIVVSSASNGGPSIPMCSSTLTVVDTQPPTATAHTMSLWPPNHKYHHVAVSDCVAVTDACDPAVKVWLTSASSDEPANATGDGNTEDDIANLGCDGVDVRSERQGTGDGRVYTLGWHAEDHAGHGIDGTCHVVVPHDQSGAPAVDSGVDHQVDLAPGTCH